MIMNKRILPNRDLWKRIKIAKKNKKKRILWKRAEAKAAAAKILAAAKAKAAAAKKKTTITCVKGKLIKKVTAVKPVCPKGYKKK